jgi:hypothetical protein
MGSLRLALSGLIVVLAPMLVYWVAGLISGGFQRRHGEHRRGRPVKKEKEPAERREAATPGEVRPPV